MRSNLNYVPLPQFSDTQMYSYVTKISLMTIDYLDKADKLKQCWKAT